MKCFLRSAVRHTHCSHHLTAIGTTTSSCCRIQEEFYVSVFWKKNSLHESISHQTHCKAATERLAFRLQQTQHDPVLRFCGATTPTAVLTHIRFVFGHSGHCVLMSSEFNVCLSSHSAIWSNFNVYSYRVQR